MEACGHDFKGGVNNSLDALIKTISLHFGCPSRSSKDEVAGMRNELGPFDTQECDRAVANRQHCTGLRACPSCSRASIDFINAGETGATNIQRFVCGMVCQCTGLEVSPVRVHLFGSFYGANDGAGCA
jgi:hypothetical protein